jgi:hypothetical protein
MGLRDKRKELLEEKDARDDRDANPDEQWEYLARNLAKVPGMAIESDFNKHGRKGWEFVGITGTDKDHYAIFKRRRPAPLVDIPRPE